MAIATRALFTGTVPDAPPRAQVFEVSPKGGWYWLAERMAYQRDGKTIVGVLSGDGDPLAFEYVHATQTASTPAMLYEAHSPFEVDDHDNPAFLRLPSGIILAAWTIHTGAGYTNHSTSPDDATAWDGNVNITSQLGFTADPPHGVTYPGLHRIGSTIYLTLRFHDEEFTPRLAYSTSIDEGETWSELQTVVEQNYHRTVQDGDRIHVMLSGHPVFDAENGIHHIYLEDGDWHTTDGTVITAEQPFALSEATQVYDGSTVGAWLYDIAVEPGTRYPIMVFATFPEADDHRYQYARWDGDSWVVHEIVEAGAGITVTPRFEDSGEDLYSGGIAIDHTDPTIVFASRQTGAGRWDMFRMSTDDHGETWGSTQLTSSGKHFRPYVVRDHAPGLHAVWAEGDFTNYVDYDLRTMGVTR